MYYHATLFQGTFFSNIHKEGHIINTHLFTRIHLRTGRYNSEFPEFPIKKAAKSVSRMARK